MNEHSEAITVPTSCVPSGRLGAAAFTLIEMAIVLVIIGLVVGGVLVGQSLIVAARARSEITEIQKFQVAVTTFESKYGCKPGDCANATAFGLAQCVNDAGSGNGNGDGTLQGWVGAGYQLEPFLLFQHLNAAGLFNSESLGYGQVYPACGSQGAGWGPLSAMADGSILSVFTYGSSLTPILSISKFDYSYSWASPTLTTGSVSAMDTKIDDGLPASGKFQSFGHSSTGGFDAVGFVPSAGPAGDGASCTNNSVTPNGYNLKNTQAALCLPAYFFDF